MKVEEVSVADGRIESVETRLDYSDVVLIDWQEVVWRLRFSGILAIENINIEGEELDRLEVTTHDPYIDRIRMLVDEPDTEVWMYSFFIPWKDEPRLRLVASGCNVKNVSSRAVQ